MDIPAVMLGVILGLVWFLVDLELKQQKQRGTATGASFTTSFPARAVDGGMPFAYPTHFPRISLPLQPPLTQPSNTQPVKENSGKMMLQTWRSSVVGLVKLAQRNVVNARQCLERGDFGAAVEAATTSIENISRALLHCYGEKPELGTGQEEALKLLARRFRGSENTDIINTIGEISRLEHNTAVYKSLSKPDADCTTNQDKAKTVESILDSASRVVSQFSEIIREHFATEIPELTEVCPKCHSMEVSVTAFDESTVRYTCASCMHSWNEPRG